MSSYKFEIGFVCIRTKFYLIASSKLSVMSSLSRNQRALCFWGRKILGRFLIWFLEISQKYVWYWGSFMNCGHLFFLKFIAKMVRILNKWLGKAKLLFTRRRLGAPSLIKKNQNKDQLYNENFATFQSSY